MSIDIVIAPVINEKGLYYKAYECTKKKSFFGEVSYSYRTLHMTSNRFGYLECNYPSIPKIKEVIILNYGTQARILEWEAINE